MSGKITSYGSLSVPATGDQLAIVDVSDTSMASSGTTKKISAGGVLPVPPSGDASGATDYANIQAVVSAGSCCLQPGQVYTVNQTILLPSAGGALFSPQRWNGATIKQANGANLDAVIASNGWYSNNGTADSPQSVMNIQVDGNTANQSGGLGMGLVIMSFWNNIHNNTVKNTRGDGIRLSAYNRGGTKITGTAIENHVWRNDVRSAGGYGIWVFDSTPTSSLQVTDGWMRDNIIQTPTLDGIRIDDGEGWVVDGNHLYGCTQHAIHIGRASNARVTANFVETWGTSATPGTYAAIAMGDGSVSFIGSANPNVIAGNVAFNAGGQTGGTVLYGILYAVSSTVTGNISITGNSLIGNGFFTAIHGAHQSGTAASNVRLTGNQLTNWAANWVPPATGTTIASGDDLIVTGIFGNGSDGALVFDGSTTILGVVPSGSTYTMSTLARDIQATAITINNGVTVKFGGYRVFCKGPFVINTGGIINQVGNAGGATGTAGGAGNTGNLGSGLPGGAGTTTVGAAGTAGFVGSAAGGAGGLGASGAGGAGGTTTSISTNAYTTVYPLLAGVSTYFQSAGNAIKGGPGGGGGGGDTTNAGGGGGGGGGVFACVAYSFVNNGTITMQGGAGGTTTLGNTGGGGGGSGGLILVYTLSSWTAGTTNVTGGAGGGKTGTGVVGTAGGNGSVLNVVVS